MDSIKIREIASVVIKYSIKVNWLYLATRTTHMDSDRNMKTYSRLKKKTRFDFKKFHCSRI